VVKDEVAADDDRRKTDRQTTYRLSQLAELLLAMPPNNTAMIVQEAGR